MTVMHPRVADVPVVPGGVEPWPLAALIHLQAGIVILDEATRGVCERMVCAPLVVWPPMG